MFEATFAIAAKFPIPMRGNEHKKSEKTGRFHWMFPMVVSRYLCKRG